MIISLVSSTLLLGSILKKGKTYVREEIEEEFIMECQKFVIDFQEGNTPPKPRRSFDSFWEMRCVFLRGIVKPTCFDHFPSDVSLLGSFHSFASDGVHYFKWHLLLKKNLFS